MEAIMLTLVILSLGLVTGSRFGSHVPDSYCVPGEVCWPGLDDILFLDDSITGRVFQPLDPEYHFLSPMKSLQYRKHPAIIAQVASMNDVQEVVLFAQRFNIRLAIYSTGHDNNGLSTAHGCLQISMVNMDRIDINLFDSASDTGASVTVQTGNTWRRIYQAVDVVSKVVVGGYCNDVGPGGYTAGGGHSPLSRPLGLAADNCIAATIILPGGLIAYLNSTGTTLVDLGGQVFSFAYTDLFWAIRGGGGGTYGVIIDYTFKLHEPPAQLVEYAARYPMDGIGESVINFFHQLIPTLPNEWYAGFIYTVPPVPIPGLTGVIIITMLHYGPWEQATRMAIQPLEELLPGMRIMSAYTNHTSYWSFAQGELTAVPSRKYLSGIFVPAQKLTPSLTHFYVNTIQTAPLYLNGTSYTCAGTVVGGRVSELNDGSNAVSQNFRQSMVVAFCIISWDDPRSDSVGAALGRNIAQGLYQFSQGAYWNEAAYDLPNWRQDFWGANYNRLLRVKRLWDRNNVFYCHHCVGDESDIAGNPPRGTILKGPAK